MRAEASADRDGLYDGIGGLAPLLAELRLSRPWTPAEQHLAAAVAARLVRHARTRHEPSLGDGLAGNAVAVRLLSPGAEQEVLARLRDLTQPDGWPSVLGVEPDSSAPLTDLLLGTAGVVLTALWAGGADATAIAEQGCAALLAVAEQTPGGLDWRMHPRYPRSSPNYAHGTAGVAAALAVAGAVLGRSDLIESAVLGAEHLLSVAVLRDGAFVVPHTIPDSTREVEPLTYGWCHGPTGTVNLFTALALAGVDEVGGVPVRRWRERGLQTVLDAGVPERLRPGFWDNDGRCCGTAGVGEALLDAAQDAADPAVAAPWLKAADRMGQALVERAVVDDSGARWSFREHRVDPPDLPPATGLMQGAAGIATFLLRLARVHRDGLTAAVVDLPDRWWSVPSGLRTVRGASA